MIFCVGAPKKVDNRLSLPKCDAAVLGFGGLGKIDYEEELKGVTDKFEDVVKLSKRSGCAVFGGCYTSSRGVVRKSVAVADGGKLLGISDMHFILDGSELKSGAGLGVYTVAGYRVGLCIENDLLFPGSIKALSLCGCNVVVAFLEEIKSTLPVVIIRAYSYLFGIPIIMCAGKTSYYSEVTGEIVSSSAPLSLFDVSFSPKFRKVTTRTKGLNVLPDDDY